MSLKPLLLRTLATVSLGMGLAFAPISHAQVPATHVVIEPAQPSDTAGKVEVLEFFAYTCPHCATMEPMVERWSQTLPDNVVVKPVPVAFNAGMADLQKLYYSLEALDRLDLHPKVFQAIHNERKRIYNFDAISDWVKTQGVDPQQFQAAFKSFGVNNKVARANELAKTYNIEGTPSLAVGGRYVTSPSMTNTYEGAIAEAQKLLDTILASQ
ncbi:MAG: thiol:disulfide interchange protein DsbA/DsbL [Alcaligenaceae bacterium]|nr:thiol:disulfide interchange protein DsbA/DsbL [Alcaligenaceae bacterium]